MKVDLETTFRGLPKVGDVLDSETGRALLQGAPRWAVVAAIRAEIARLREDLRTGGSTTQIDPAQLASHIARQVRPSLEHVVNATGVVLHTNLGRAPLAEAAVEQIGQVARRYSNLEYHLDEGARSSRHVHATHHLRALTGAEDAVVVNNCAAAVLLALTVLARDGRVVVSRGELVEIGGGFRIPEVMEASGATLVEVGTTNRTRIADYAHALDEIGADQPSSARLLMKVHRSNFAIVGFTEEPTIEELVALARVRGLPLFVDLGAGALQALPGADEPTVAALIAAGVDLVAFSGDKRLGGPQAGVLVGKADLVARLAKHPLMRALRPDKLTLAALDATLALHRADRTEEIPAIAMLRVPEPTLQARAERLAERLAAARPDGTFAPVRVRSAVGGGALPGVEPWSWAVRAAVRGYSAQALDAALRRGAPPVVGRIADGHVLLDTRTLAEGPVVDELIDLVDAFALLPGACL
jgi:L-seryl-tRNA(Ser) seleniumtransferase